MKFKNYIFLLLIYITNKGVAQEFISGIVLDKQTKKPLEFVDIYSIKDSTYTNEEGKFNLLKEGGLIEFSLIGYETTLLTTNELKNNGDTILLEPKVYVLPEITVKGTTSLFKKMIKSVEHNYPSETYKEDFFLRCLLKKK